MNIPDRPKTWEDIDIPDELKVTQDNKQFLILEKETCPVAKKKMLVQLDLSFLAPLANGFVMAHLILQSCTFFSSFFKRAIRQLQNNHLIELYNNDEKFQ